MGADGNSNAGPGMFPVQVRHCARCGGDHDLVFRRLQVPHNEYTHWCACPATGEPVLLEFCETRDLVTEHDVGKPVLVTAAAGRLIAATTATGEVVVALDRLDVRRRPEPPVGGQ